MTNEEAIKNVKRLKKYICDGNPMWKTSTISESLDLAILALEQPERSLMANVELADCIIRINEYLLDHPEETEQVAQWTYSAQYEPVVKEDVYGDISSIELTGSAWDTRRKSNLIKWLMEKSDIEAPEMAAHLGYSKTYLDNKLQRNSFSFENILKAAEASGYTLILSSIDGTVKRRLRFSDFVKEDV